MKRLIFALMVIALLVPAAAFATAEEPPNPYCTWVEPTTEQVWVDPVTEVRTVVDQEAYDETIPGECYPAVTHEEYVPPVTHTELSCDGVGVNWQRWSFPWNWIFVEYDKKTGDTHKCHMPTASDLMNEYGMGHAEKTFFRAHKPDWILGNQVTVIDEPGYWKTVVDQEAYCDPDTVIHHDAVTHEETVTVEEGYYKTVTLEEGYWDCPEMCEYNLDIPADDPKCKPPVTCYWDQKYKMATFEKEGEPNCYLVSWDEDYAPNSSRQLCNCGWIADNMSDFEWVEVNSCTGAIRYDGMDWGKFYREDLMYPHWGDNACLNVGGC